MAKKKVAKKAPTKKSPAKSKKAAPKAAKAKKAPVKSAPATKKSPKLTATKSKPSIDWSKYLAPLYDKVLLELEPLKETTDSGLILIDSAPQKRDKAEVLAIGKGALKKKGKVLPLDVKVGDKVLFNEYAGNVIQAEGRDLVVVSETDIIGVIS
ncbi:MAG: co-chaperone GroES [Bdellovibrionota bacterium]